jgi:hypothetical protein
MIDYITIQSKPFNSPHLIEKKVSLTAESIQLAQDSFVECKGTLYPAFYRIYLPHAMLKYLNAKKGSKNLSNWVATLSKSWVVSIGS